MGIIISVETTHLSKKHLSKNRVRWNVHPPPAGDAVGCSESIVGDAVFVVGACVIMSMTLHVTPGQQYAPSSHSLCSPDPQCVSTEHQVRRAAESSDPRLRTTGTGTR